MKMWQIFTVGVTVLGVALLLPLYEPAIAAIGALVLVAVVMIGFLAHPRHDVFYIRTTIYSVDADDEFSMEHDCIAVRVELARLWLLFLPTFCALAFLLVTFSKGKLWNFSLLDRFVDVGAVSFVMYRLLLFIVVGILSPWISERWVLRDADACSAGSVSVQTGRISYMFVDRRGEYYGGEGFPFGLARPVELATIILYSVRKPQLNKIAMGCLFHRLVIIGRGINDLDEATIAAQASLTPAPSTPPTMLTL